MVSNDVVLQTVKRMVSSGVDDETVKMTLKGINLSEDEIEAVLNEAKGITPKAAEASEKAVSNESLNGKIPSAKPPESAPSKPAEQTSSQTQKNDGPIDGDENIDDGIDGDLDSGFDDEPTHSDMKDKLEAVSQEQSAQHTTTHELMDEHSSKINDVKKGVENLHKKFESAPSLSPETISQLSVLGKRISSLEKSVSETKANTVALQNLLTKILDANKKIILELQKK